MGREEIFNRIRAALVDVTQAEPTVDVPIPGDTEGTAGDTMGTVLFVSSVGESTVDTVELFTSRVLDYKATVRRVTDSTQIPALVVEFLKEVRADSCVVPAGLEPLWYAEAQQAGVKVMVDDPPLSKEALDACSAVLTAVCLGMAETGTMVLDHRAADQGRRIISLLPDTLICVIRADQVLTDVPQAMAQLAPLLQEGRPLTWISGPSATSDIELSRVEGVHGPRNLYVIIY